MSHKLRTAEQVCIAYADASALVRSYGDIARAHTCTKVLEYCAAVEEMSVHSGDLVNPDPCIMELFNLKRDPNGRESEYIEEQNELEDNLCDPCMLALKAYRDRKVARKRLGAAKRAVESVGKRLKGMTV